MIKQMKTLLRVKELKQEQALTAMQAKRQQLEVARAARLRAKAAVDESAATYDAREDAIYAEIIGQIIDQGDVDTTQGRVVQLEKDHSLLKDALERALHVEARVEKELEVATAAYFAALKIRDKFQVITDDLQQTLNAEVEYNEEMEVEDMFATARKKAA
jgi:hypothetical protein